MAKPKTRPNWKLAAERAGEQVVELTQACELAHQCNEQDAKRIAELTRGMAALRAMNENQHFALVKRDEANAECRRRIAELERERDAAVLKLQEAALEKQRYQAAAMETVHEWCAVARKASGFPPYRAWQWVKRTFGGQR